MTQEDKNLLLKDLCARLPYGVILNNPDPYGGNWDELISIDVTTDTVMLLYNVRTYNIEDIKPYLRPMSSMTEEEKSYVQQCIDIVEAENYGDSYSPAAWEAMSDFTNYCYERHLDLHGLIPKGLALNAPEGMYKEE